MQPSYRKWTVRGYLRPVVEWDEQGVRVPAGHVEPVVVVFDPRGWQWEVTVDDGGLTSLTIRGLGQHVDQAAVRVPPLGYLAEVASAYVGEVERADAAGLPLSSALEGADQDPGQPRVRGDAPTLEEFADAWHSTPAAGFPGGLERLTRRRALARRFFVSVHTVDKWTRAARDRGLIPRATTGRSRKPQDTPATPGGRTNTEETK